MYIQGISKVITFVVCYQHTNHQFSRSMQLVNIMNLWNRQKSWLRIQCALNNFKLPQASQVVRFCWGCLSTKPTQCRLCAFYSCTHSTGLVYVGKGNTCTCCAVQLSSECRLMQMQHACGIGLGTLCRHNFEHNSSLLWLEHNWA